jgi:hypothetical protein
VIQFRPQSTLSCRAACATILLAAREAHLRIGDTRNERPDLVLDGNGNDRWAAGARRRRERRRCVFPRTRRNRSTTEPFRGGNNVACRKIKSGHVGRVLQDRELLQHSVFTVTRNDIDRLAFLLRRRGQPLARSIATRRHQSRPRPAPRARLLLRQGDTNGRRRIPVKPAAGKGII